MASEPLTAALLLDGPALSNWTARALEQAVTRETLEITRIVINEAVAESVEAGHPIQRARRYLRTARSYGGAWAAVSAFHSVICPPEYLRSRPLEAHESWLGTPKRIHCVAEPAEGLGNQLPKEVVAEVAENADVVFRFGFGILKGDILTAPKYGVLSFHHGDIRTYRGSPTHVWEFLNDETETGVTLQYLTETLDGGRVVVFKPVDIGDAQTWQEIKYRKFHASEGMLATAVRRLRDPTFTPETVERLGDLYTKPTTVETLRILRKTYL